MGRLFTRRESPSSDDLSTVAPTTIVPSIQSTIAPSLRSSFTARSMCSSIKNKIARAATLASADAFCFEYLDTRKYRVYTVRTFCESLLNSSRASNARIVSVKRYGDRHGVPHRFLIFHINRTDGKDFYLRVDRRRDHTISLLVFAARDRGRSSASDTARFWGLCRLYNY